MAGASSTDGVKVSAELAFDGPPFKVRRLGLETSTVKHSSMGQTTPILFKLLLVK